MYKTPVKDKCTEEENDVHTLCNQFRTFDICSVCLSPCQELPVNLTGTSIETSSGSHNVKQTVETTCKHNFHAKCLNEAKAIKPECPMCRCPLTPLQESQAQANYLRQEIVSNASRARNAVRAGILRRQQQVLLQQQQQQQQVEVQ